MTNNEKLLEYRITELEADVLELEKDQVKMLELFHKLAIDTKVETSKINTKITIYIGGSSALILIIAEVLFGRWFG